MGQATMKLNLKLLASCGKQCDWFNLQKRKTKEHVSGSIQLQIEFGKSGLFKYIILFIIIIHQAFF